MRANDLSVQRIREHGGTVAPGDATENAYIERVSELLDLANLGLVGMQRADGLFCYDQSHDELMRRGYSVRYSIISLLGLVRFEQNGREPCVRPDVLREAIERHQRRRELGIGDASLLLWADVRRHSDDAETSLDRLARLDTSHHAIEQLESMEIAWWVIGAAEACRAGFPAQATLDDAVEELRKRRSPRSPLFRHIGSGWRASLPNFATEIYSLLALAHLVQLGRHDFAERWAIDLGNELIELQLDDGAWPWLFHSESATVVEPYEVYSVHQDAMAPMAFLTLAEATGRAEYAKAAISGLNWCYGANQLGAITVDRENLFVDRSIRRRGVSHRANLVGNTVLRGLLGIGTGLDIGGLEVNRTCRPYHLGWILEAWSGRHDLVEQAIGSVR